MLADPDVKKRNIHKIPIENKIHLNPIPNITKKQRWIKLKPIKTSRQSLHKHRNLTIIVKHKPVHKIVSIKNPLSGQTEEI